MALALRYAVRSHVGNVREGNEDSGYAGPRLLVVADGMGGHAAGEVASSIAVATLSALDEDTPGPDLLDRLAGAVTSANDHLREMVEGDPHLHGMGTTLTALLRNGSRFGLVHVGDSRCYLLRGEALQQITHDHTFVQSLVDEGRITAEEAAHHPQRSIITNALDGRGSVEPDISVREVRGGDRWMLCSDGLSAVVSEQTMQETLGRGSPDDAAEALIDLALRGGGPDNITVIVADVVDVDSSPPDIPEVVGAVASGPLRYRRDDGRGAAPRSAAARAAALRSSSRPAADQVLPASPRRSRRGGWLTLLAAVVVVALVATGATALYRWSRQQYYVGADDSGHVAIYRGLSQNILGWHPSSVFASERSIPVAELSAYSRRSVETSIPADDLTDARAIVARLDGQVRACRVARARPAPTATPPTPGTPPAGTPGPVDGTAPGATATPVPTLPSVPTPTPTERPSPGSAADNACPDVP